LRRWASALALAGLLGAAPVAPALSREAVPAAGKPQTGLRIIPLSIETADGKRHAYKVEVAATPQQQAHGMMFRTSVPPGTGMFFPMEPPRAASFWMENTLIPLDLIFIGADGRIRNIVAGAVPGSRAPLASVGPVVAVLELRGGEAERIGARPGDMIIWPR
jgi:uncharacterized membrane protein (UPF0127 family)